jgi:hypothetical protein
MSYDELKRGQKLLSAVERVIAPSEDIISLVERLRAQAGPSRRALGQRLISHFSNRSALVGGATALPGLVPGLGTLAVALGSSLADMAAVLKLEVEMCLAIDAAYGYDIRLPEERQFALLLAAVKTHEIQSGRNALLDLGEVSGTALWSYGPREASKLLLQVLGAFGLVYATKYAGQGLLRAIPFLGIGVGAGLNKMMSARVGERALDEIALRASLDPSRR